MSAAAPPAMTVSLPLTARRTPPETGASISAMPRSASMPPSSRVSSGAEELMSITSAPSPSDAAAPSAPSRAARTMALFGSMVIRTPAPSAAAAPLARSVPPCAANAARAASTRS